MTAFYQKGGILEGVTSEILSAFAHQLLWKKQKETMTQKEQKNSPPMSDHQFYVLMLTIFVILIGFWISKTKQESITGFISTLSKSQ